VKNKSVTILILSITVIAAILRLIHPLQIPYTYDELSALLRTHFNSFSELINKGIIIDGHPAGVQVFLYYWTKLFGYNEIVVKFPFIVAGIISVYLIFKIGQTWFTSTVGLVCAAYLATLEYPIMYSQIIRPYSSGLLFSLAMVYYWSKIILTPNEKPYKNLGLYVLFSALCAYNHHFTLLFAAIVGLTGLLFIKKKHLIKYIAAGISIFILYIPHLRIFFYQLNHGGIGGADGWLGKPALTFPLEYLYYVFHFSRTVLGLVALIVFFSIYSAIKNKTIHLKFLIISFLWFFLPLLIGFLYSTFVNPVLQYSMLLFTFPFLLLFLFGSLTEQSLNVTIPVLILICAINIFSLVHTRKYYTLFYKAPYEQPIIINDSLVKALGKDNYNAILQTEDSDKYVTDYYIHKDQADSTFHKAIDFGCSQISGLNNYLKLIHFMEEQKKPYFGFGATAAYDPIVQQIISNYYPFMIKRWDFYDANFFLYSKNRLKNNIDQYSFQSKNDFEKPTKNWSDADTNFTHDTIHFSGKHSYKMDEHNAWAPAFSCKLNNMSWGKNDIIFVSLQVYPLDTLEDVSIVSSLESGGNILEWNETKINKFIPDTLRKKWVKVYHMLKMQDVHLDVPDLLIKVYIWNKGRKRFYMDDFTIKTFKGNPIIYGLMQKI
jgi:hypothetical protein